MARKQKFSMANTMTFGSLKTNEPNSSSDTNNSEKYDSTSTALDEEIASNVLKEDEHETAEISESKETDTMDEEIQVEDNNTVPKNELEDSVSKKEVDVTADPIIVKKDDSSYKKTSLTLHRKCVNFLAYMAKKNSCNQNEYLTRVLLEEQDKPYAITPNFDTIVTKRDTYDTIIKAIQLPESVLRRTKEMAASELKSISQYVDDILIDRIENMER